MDGLRLELTFAAVYRECEAIKKYIERALCV